VDRLPEGDPISADVPPAKRGADFTLVDRLPGGLSEAREPRRSAPGLFLLRIAICEREWIARVEFCDAA
jgi:hypothetical protein